jgi:hypothetical protein
MIAVDAHNLSRAVLMSAVRTLPKSVSVASWDWSEYAARVGVIPNKKEYTLGNFEQVTWVCGLGGKKGFLARALFLRRIKQGRVSPKGCID